MCLPRKCLGALIWLMKCWSRIFPCESKSRIMLLRLISKRQTWCGWSLRTRDWGSNSNLQVGNNQATARSNKTTSIFTGEDRIQIKKIQVSRHMYIMESNLLRRMMWSEQRAKWSQDLQKEKQQAKTEMQRRNSEGSLTREVHHLEIMGSHQKTENCSVESWSRVFQEQMTRCRKNTIKEITVPSSHHIGTWWFRMMTLAEVTR